LIQRESELAILNSVSEAMAKTLDVKTVTRIVGDKVQNIFASEVVNIRLYDPATNIIQRAYDYERGFQDLTHTSFPMGKGLTSKIIEAGKPLVFGTEQEMDNEGALTAPKLASTPTEETQSYMGVPIIAGDKVIGTVSVQSYKQHAYNENHVRLMQTLSANMGVAIQNARLFEAEQERVAELQERRPEPVPPGVQVALDELIRLEGPQEPVHGRLRHPQAFRELGHAEMRVPRPELAEDRRRAAYRLDHGSASAAVPSAAISSASDVAPGS